MGEQVEVVEGVFLAELMLKIPAELDCNSVKLFFIELTIYFIWHEIAPVDEDHLHP
jgi:hypothetical protein